MICQEHIRISGTKEKSMKVNKIIEYACLMLNKASLLDSPIFLGQEDENEERSAQLTAILQCVNSTLLKVATYYKPLTASIVLDSKEQIDLSSKVDQTIQNILSVKTVGGRLVSYKIEGKYILLPNVGEVCISYSYYPKEVDFGEEVSYFAEEIAERILAYSVVSDYYFHNGIEDEMTRYDEEFQNAMRTITRKKAEIYIKPRRWV